MWGRFWLGGAIRKRYSVFLIHITTRERECTQGVEIGKMLGQTVTGRDRSFENYYFPFSLLPENELFRSGVRNPDITRCVSGQDLSVRQYRGTIRGCAIITR